MQLYNFLLQNFLKYLPDRWFEKAGGPFYKSLSYALPFEQKSTIIYTGIPFTAHWGFASGWADNLSKMFTIKRLGAGAVISKTITVKPREGNPYPRLIRYQTSIINSMGLPNTGLSQWIQEINKTKNLPNEFIYSVKGNNQYEWGLLVKSLSKYCKIIELNFSCPNIEEGIINIAKSQEILSFIRNKASTAKLFLKLSPEYKTNDLIELIKSVKDKNLIDGVTCFNTIPVKHNYLGNKEKKGGLSGTPLFSRLIGS
ncbi:MAG: hypothetical protein ACXAC7_08320, partial [Candidatus Hodarchaeales archaeon]